MSLQNVNPSLTYQVKVSGACAAIQTLNVFYYASSELLTIQDIEDFVTLFSQNVLTSVSQIITNATVFNNVTVTSLDNLRFVEVPINVVGQNPGQTMPPFVTWGFRFTRSVAGVRGGYKRFSGVPEQYTANGVWDYGTGVQDLINDVRSKLTGPANVNGKTMDPIVIVSTFNGQTLPTPKYWSPTGCVLAPRPGSQNTRKK
jgi:hypothetical protein